MKAKIYILLLSLLLCFFVYPSSFIHPKDTLPDNNDTRLITYIINQVQINTLNGNSIFYGTYFAPEKNTLTYSDLFLTTATLSLPLRLFTSDPILIFNLIWIIGFILTLYTSFIFFKNLTNDHLTALLGAIVFNLSGIHLHYYAHFQIFNLWIVFAALLTTNKYINTNKSKYLYIYLALFSLQLFESIFTTYLLGFASVFLFANTVIKQKPKLHPLSLFFPISWLAYLWPYYQTHLAFPEAERSIHDAAHNSLSLIGYFTHHQATLSLLLLLISLIIFLRKKEPNPGQHPITNMSVLSLFLFSSLMSLGPVLKLIDKTLKPFSVFGLEWPIPLPYSAFYYLFPGFQGFRTPSRFMILTLLSLVIILVANISNFKLKNITKTILILFFLTLLSLENKLPLSGYPINLNPPSVYNSLYYLPKDSVLLELPIKLWNMSDHQVESVRSLYSLDHGLRRLGGYSGFASMEWIKLVEEINSEGLSETVKQKLKSRGVTHIIQNNTLSQLR